MGIKEAIEFMLEEVGKKTTLAEITKVSRQTYYDVLQDKQKDGPTWETVLAMSSGVDKHLFAHIAFDLPEPEALGEIGGKKKELCDLVLGLDDIAVAEILGFAYRLTQEGGEERARDGPV